MQQYDPSSVDPLTGLPMAPQQTINTPMPSNQKGNARPVFSPLANTVGNNLFGNPQEGLANPPMFPTEQSKYNNQELT